MTSKRKYAQRDKIGLIAFVDPEGYRRYVAEREQAFRNELAKQTGGKQ